MKVPTGRQSHLSDPAKSTSDKVDDRVIDPLLAPSAFDFKEGDDWQWVICLNLRPSPSTVLELVYIRGR